MKKILLIVLALALPSFASAATLTLSPASQSVNADSTFAVTINLDTAGTMIDGTDIRYLNYNPSLLRVESVTPGILMPLTLANNINSSAGRITFSQVSAGGNKYTGSGVLATIKFRALAGGTASVTFDSASGNTTDSNVAANGSDVLTSVVNGSYTISGTPPPASSGGGSTGGGGGGGGSSSGVGLGNSGYTSPISVGGGQILRNLYQGVKGDDVIVLQKFLVSQGYITADNVTGFYGPATQSAVQTFQKANGIVSSGNPLSTGYGSVGPSTRSQINKLLGGTAPVFAGNTLTPAQKAAIQAQINTLLSLVAKLMAQLQALQAAGR